MKLSGLFPVMDEFVQNKNHLPIVIIILLTSLFCYPTQPPTQRIIIDGGGGMVHIHSTIVDREIIIKNAQYTIIENLTITDGGRIYQEIGDYSIIRNNVVKNSNSYGAIFAYKVDNVKIINNTVMDTSADGIIGYGVTNLTISDNYVKNTVKNGIYARAHNVLISNNRIVSIEGTGIYMDDSTNVTIRDNMILDIKWKPIALDSSTYDETNLSNNTIDGDELSSNTVSSDIISSEESSSDISTQPSSGDELNSHNSMLSTWQFISIFSINLVLIVVLKKIKK